MNESRFPGYRDVVQVGEGGLGNVYRAVRESTGGVVAIKELREVGVGSPVWHRARRELEALLRLKGHPNVVNVEEIVEGPLGPCLVMEFASGGSLMDRLAGGSLAGPELVLVGQHVCGALVSAHELGIVHRDIKPHNLLVGSFGQVKVCDFGIAALMRGAEGRTQTQAMTLAYASPEELDGADEVGPPADAYSFGATFLHLATGRRPSFKDRTDANIGAQLQELDEDPALVSLSGAIRRCLLHEPADRPTMVELSKLFEQVGAALGDRRLQGLLVSRPEGDGSSDRVAVANMPATMMRPLQSDPTVAAMRANRPPRASGGYAAPMVIGTPARTVLRPPAAPTVDPASTRPGTPTRPNAATVGLASHRGRRKGWVVAGLAVIAAVGAVIVGMVISGQHDDSTPIATASAATTPAPKVPATETPITARAAAPTTVAPTTTPATTVAPTTTPATTVAAVLRPSGPVTLTGPIGAIWSVAYSPDGSRVVTGSANNTAIVWDAATGDQLATLTGHSDWVLSVAYSPNGNRIVTGSGDGAAIVWDAATGDRLATLTGHSWPVESVAYSPDGSRIVTGSFDGTAIVWDGVTGDRLATLTGQNGGVWSVAYSPDGSRIVTGSADGLAIVWDAGTGDQLATLTGHADSVNSVAYSPDGSRIVTGSPDGTAIVWDAGTGDRQVTLTGYNGAVLSVAYSPDGTRIVTGGGDGTAIVWDAGSGDQLATLTGHTAAVRSVDYSPDGNRIVTGSIDGDAIVWDATGLAS